MKNLRNLLALLVLVNIVFTSCTKKETTSNDNQDQTENSQVTETITQNLYARTTSSQDAEDGTDVQRYLEFDYCFTFAYPITLSYNNGTQVVVNDNTQLLTIISGMTATSYINGIAFPFDINTPNGLVTVNNETAFAAAINSCDTDNDGIPNHQDNDDDGDGINDQQEDLNHDGNETNDDTDGDGTPNYQDSDDDGDGIETADEDLDQDGNPLNDDTDGDGTPNCQDDDDDNDGVLTADEDNNHNGSVTDDDSDNDGTSDYLDTDSDNDGIDDGNDSDADGDGQEDDQENDNDSNDDD